MELNKIYNENCLDTMKRMQDNFIDLTITSPPYDNIRTYKGYNFEFEEIAKELYRTTKEGGVVVWNVNDATIKGKIKTFNAIKVKKKDGYIKGVQKWHRSKEGEYQYKEVKKDIPDRVRYNVWRYPIGSCVSSDKIAFQHPAIMPEKMASEHIYSWSNKGDIVYDCFMGSGTTAVCAYKLNRKFIGSDMSKEYVDIANKRLQPYLNQTKLF